MADILHHDLPLRADELGRDLQAVLDAMPPQPTGDPLPVLQLERGDHSSLVFTGAYSTGKSSLIKALTNGEADVVIAADIATDRVSEYDWNEVVTLIDTPGMHAGLAEHDAIAEDALIRADLVLFTVTVELFDDDATAQLRHVLDDLGKREQTIIVITKAGGMTAAPGVRAEAVRVAAQGDDVPFVECDAELYLRSLVELDPQRCARLIAASNMEGVARALNELAVQRGQLARHRQPFQQIRAIAEDAVARLADDPSDAAMLRTLARQRKALTDHEGRIEAMASAAANLFLATCANAAERFADAIEAADDTNAADPGGPARRASVEVAEGDLQNALQVAVQRMSSEIDTIINIQMQDLQSEVLEIESGPSAQYISNMERPVVAMPDGPSIPSYSERASDTPPMRLPAWLSDAQRMLAEFIGFWGAGGGMRNSSGTTGHQIVLEVGDILGKKFKPWGAVRIANGIGKVATIAAVAVPIAINVAGVVMDEVSRRKAEEARFRRRRSLLLAVMEQATAIADEARSLVRGEIRRHFSAPYEAIDEMRSRVLDAQQTRSTLTQELGRISAACEEHLARTETPVA